MSSKKNQTLELFKLLASFMVVFIHVPFYDQAGVIFNTLARFAVPLFLLISGFYSYQIPLKSIKKRIRNVLTILVLSVVCYTLFNMASLLAKGNIGGILLYFGQYINWSTLVKLLLFNMPVCATHIWYLYAIIYVYIIFYIATAIRLNEKIIFAASFILLFLHILLGEGLSIIGISIPIIFIRNFAFMGIPFFGLGLLAKKYENKIFTIPNYVSIIFAITGVITAIVSQFLFGTNELYIGSILILFAIVCVFIKYSTTKFPSFLTSLEGCSTYIYIFHIMIASVFSKIYAFFGFDKNSSIILKNIHPLIVCICSTIFAYIIVQIFKKVSKAK